MREAEWSQALLFLAGGLKAGMSLEEALDVFAREAPASLGIKTNDTWTPLTNRIQTIFQGKELELVRAALLFSQKAGGRAAPLLERCAHTLQMKHEMTERARALTTQGRLSAWIVGLTPIGILGGFAIFSPDYIAPLFQTRQGELVLILAATLISIGFLLIRRIVRVSW